MDSPRFMLGVMIGSLLFAFVMINIWAWNIVPIERMVEFNRDPMHVYLVTAIALGTMVVCGFLCATFFKNRKK